MGNDCCAGLVGCGKLYFRSCSYFHSLASPSIFVRQYITFDLVVASVILDSGVAKYDSHSWNHPLANARSPVNDAGPGNFG